VGKVRKWRGEEGRKGKRGKGDSLHGLTFSLVYATPLGSEKNGYQSNQFALVALSKDLN